MASKAVISVLLNSKVNSEFREDMLLFLHYLFVLKSLGFQFYFQTNNTSSLFEQIILTEAETIHNKKGM